jgi:hypothetical protein
MTRLQKKQSLLFSRFEENNEEQLLLINFLFSYRMLLFAMKHLIEFPHFSNFKLHRMANNK